LNTFIHFNTCMQKIEYFHEIQHAHAENWMWLKPMLGTWGVLHISLLPMKQDSIKPSLQISLFEFTLLLLMNYPHCSRLLVSICVTSSAKTYCSFHISLSKACLAITFLLLLIFSRNFHNVCQRFLYTQKQNFSWIGHKREISS